MQLVNTLKVSFSFVTLFYREKSKLLLWGTEINYATCHTQNQEGQHSFEESIHSKGKAGEAGYGHVNGTLQEGVTL